MRKNVSYGYGLLIPLLLVGWWHWMSASGRINPGLFPDPRGVGTGFLALWWRGELVTHLEISLFRVALGFGWACLIGVPAGVLLALCSWPRKLMMPLINFLRQIPPIALVPILIVWFGLGEGSKVAVIFYAALFPILLNTFLGVSQIPKQYWEVASNLQLSLGQIITKLVFPASAASIMTGLRLAMGISWRALVAAEMLAADSGLGYLIMASRALVRLDEMVVGIILIGLIGLALDQGFLWLQEKILPWNQQINGTGGTIDGTGTVKR